jgi:hypothetical protein
MDIVYVDGVDACLVEGIAAEYMAGAPGRWCDRLAQKQV